MKKKLLIAAVGAALTAGPMVAANAGTTLYGHLHMSMDRVDNDTGAETGFMSNNSSRFGIKGDEDLGGGLKAIYQVESGTFAADEGTNGFSGTLRNTFVGFSGGWGSVKLGRHDTPFKEIGRKIDNFNEQIGDLRSMIGQDPVLAFYGYSNGYDQRVSNMIRYDSPNFGGWSGSLQNTSNDGSDNYSNTAKRNTSFSVNWSAGPMYAGLGWLEETNATFDTEETTGLRLALSYTMNDMTLGFLWEDLSDMLGISGWDRKSWALAWSMKMGNNKFKVHYVNTDEIDLSGYDQTGATMIALGVDHSFSKTTMVYFNYVMVDNDDFGLYNTTSGAVGHGQTIELDDGPNFGSSTSISPKAYSAGVIIKF